MVEGGGRVSGGGGRGWRRAVKKEGGGGGEMEWSGTTDMRFEITFLSHCMRARGEGWRVGKRKGLGLEMCWTHGAIRWLR